MEVTFQEKKLRPLAEVEQSEQMVMFRMGTRAFELVGRNKKRTLFGKGGGLDLNQPVATVGLEGTDIESQPVTLSYRNVLNPLRQLIVPSLDQPVLLNRITRCSPASPSSRLRVSRAR